MRGTRRAAKGIVAALLVVGMYDLVAPSSARGGRATEVAGATLQRVGGFDDLGRIRRSDATTTSAPPPTTARAPDSAEKAIAPPPANFTGRAPKATPPPAAIRPSRYAGVPPTSGTWAVMIGINDYPGTGHDLHSAVNDATDVNEALADMGVPGDHRLLIRDGQASAATIRGAVDWLNAHAAPDAIAVFFYAGHVRKQSSGTEALVGSDGGTIRDSELASMLEPLQARRAWIVVAACYSGGFTEVMKSGRILTAAAPADSLAYENDKFGRSYLVEYMVRRAMIQGRADGSVEASFGWAYEELRRDYPNRLPVQFDSHAGLLDLRPPGAPPRKPTSTPSGSDSGSGSGSGSSAAPRPAPTTTTTAPKNDGCSTLTLGVVKCGG